jgi:hypothetical protein
MSSVLTHTRIPAVYAIPVTVADGTTHLVADDVYTVVMVLQHQRPFSTLCASTAEHAAPTTRSVRVCPECTGAARDQGLRVSQRDAQ